MKRYRVLTIDFDSRATILNIVIDDSWEEHIKELHRRNKQKLEESLLFEFGCMDKERKKNDFCDLGAAPLSIVAFHNKFLRQIRHSFIIGAYYPSLTATCSLGERILNHLIISLREDFKQRKEYKRVYRKNSFDDWALPISVLESWGILLSKVVTDYKSLYDIRNRKAIHFNPETDKNDREIALESIKLLSNIIQEQFGALGTQPWFIKNTKGAFYIKKEYEENPFIKKIYLPNCVLVGPFHKLENTPSGWKVVDNHVYEEREITDEEFRRLSEDFREGKISS